MRTQLIRNPILTMDKGSNMRHSRIKKEIALVLIAAMIFAMVGCKKKKAGDEFELSSILSSETETTPEETTTETSEVTATTESTAAPETSEATPSETTEATTEPSDPSETTLDPTATPTDTPADPTVTTAPQPTEPKPTKAPKETKPKATVTPTTAPTNASTPTPIPTDMPTPTPTTAPKENKKATDYSSTIKSAIKQAIIDKCGWKTGFVFDNKMMENQKARAKYASNNNIIGHEDMPGTVIPLEACGIVGCIYDTEKDQLEWFWTDHAGTNHYYYDDPYQCCYDFAKFLVVEHTEKLASHEGHTYFGYGASIRYQPWERSYGLGTVEEWDVTIYIGADTEMMYNTHFADI